MNPNIYLHEIIHIVGAGSELGDVHRASIARPDRCDLMVTVVERLEHLPEDWSTALAIVAHPDDMEYGAASAVARWTSAGKDIRYVLVTRGEAGISTMPPEAVGPARQQEQRDSCLAVGVTTVEFLDHRDGLVEAGVELRRDLAAAIRRHRPDVILSINYRDSWGG